MILVLITVGAALITAAFVLLVPNPTEIAWLNLAVLLTIYFGYLSNLFIIKRGQGGFDKSIPSMGIIWTTLSYYVAISLTVMGVSTLFDLSFTAQILAQGGAWLLLVFGFTFAATANNKVAEVAKAEEKVLQPVDDMRSLATRVQSLYTGSTKWSVISSELDSICEEFRYISPSNSKDAIEYDTQLSKMLKQVYDEIIQDEKSNDLDVNEWQQKIKRFIELRKGCMTN
jgi:hypothetical protein